MTIMKSKRICVGPDLIEIIKMCYSANTPLLVRGPTGVGKTESMIAAAAVLNIACIVLDLPLMESVDLLGLPDKSGNAVKYIPRFLAAFGKRHFVWG